VSNNSSPVSSLTNAQAGVLLFSILIVALCGIVYELIIGTVSSYLLGNSVYQFSLTIGFFMFAMGLGSWISKFFDKEYIRNFVTIEVAIVRINYVYIDSYYRRFGWHGNPNSDGTIVTKK